MGAVKQVGMFAILVVVILAEPFLPGASAESAESDRSLFVQSAAQALQREFPQEELSFLLLDARSGAVLASRWANLEQPIPLGSLAKPFTALAYGERHRFHFPSEFCRGEMAGCWRPGGHGEIGIISAIAFSCNAYFRQLTVGMSGADLASTAQDFGLEPPPYDLTGAALIGVGNLWPVSPLRIARAYGELSRRRSQPGVREILAGMAFSAREGTGLEVGRALHRSSALVKTGTAACTHFNRAPGDGFVLAMTPAERPELLLLLRVHGVPGSKAALTAGKMLRRIEE